MDCRSRQSPASHAALLALVAGFAEIAGCGGSSTTGSAPQSGHRVDMKAMLSEAQTKLKVPKSGKRSKKPFVIEFPSRARE